MNGKRWYHTWFWFYFAALLNVLFIILVYGMGIACAAGVFHISRFYGGWDLAKLSLVIVVVMVYSIIEVITATHRNFEEAWQEVNGER